MSTPPFNKIYMHTKCTCNDKFLWIKEEFNDIFQLNLNEKKIGKFMEENIEKMCIKFKSGSGIKRGNKWQIAIYVLHLIQGQPTKFL